MCNGSVQDEGICHWIKECQTDVRSQGLGDGDAGSLSYVTKDKLLGSEEIQDTAEGNDSDASRKGSSKFGKDLNYFQLFQETCIVVTMMNLYDT